MFRCQPGKKIPLAETAGFKDATRVRRDHRGLVARTAEYNAAIPTGIETVDVLDVDVKPEGSGWAALNVLKRAGMLAGARAMVRTRSGGLHVYFAGTDQGCGRLPRHYLDFKATGGYVLTPPSFRRSRRQGPGWRIRGARPPLRERDAGLGSRAEPARPAETAVVPGEATGGHRSAAAGPAGHDLPRRHRLEHLRRLGAHPVPGGLPVRREVRRWTRRSPTWWAPPSRGTATRHAGPRCTSATDGSAAAASSRR